MSVQNIVYTNQRAFYWIKIGYTNINSVHIGKAYKKNHVIFLLRVKLVRDLPEANLSYLQFMVLQLEQTSNHTNCFYTEFAICPCTYMYIKLYLIFIYTSLDRQSFLYIINNQYTYIAHFCYQCKPDLQIFIKQRY